MAKSSADKQQALLRDEMRKMRTSAENLRYLAQKLATTATRSSVDELAVASSDLQQFLMAGLSKFYTALVRAGVNVDPSFAVGTGGKSVRLQSVQAAVSPVDAGAEFEPRSSEAQPPDNPGDVSAEELSVGERDVKIDLEKINLELVPVSRIERREREREWDSIEQRASRISDYIAVAMVIVAGVIYFL